MSTLNVFVPVDVKFALVSGGFTLFTDYLKDQYHLSEVLANHLEIKNGRLTGRLLGPIVDAAAKNGNGQGGNGNGNNGGGNGNGGCGPSVYPPGLGKKCANS